MKIVIAMDSFKGSMTSMEAGLAAKEGIHQVRPDTEVVVRPLADGGEGTMEALTEGLGGRMCSVNVSDPLGRMVLAKYGLAEMPETGERTAIIEMAQAAGLTLLTEEERNPYKTTTCGVGEMIRDAIVHGCRDFIVGIGGSATNDGGIGMLRSLGYCFLDKDGIELTGGAESLDKVYEISDANILPELSQCRFRIACDVENPLCGPNGATYIYAPQKGLAAGDCAKVDAAMISYADVAERFSKKACRNIPGAGAAGGMGFACLNFLGGELIRGAELVMQVTRIEDDMEGADIFVTGEGKLDGQSVMGKAPMLAAQRAKKHGCRVYVFAGQTARDAQQCLENDVDEIYAITPEGMKTETAMEKEVALRNMTETAYRVFTDKGECV